MKLRKLSMRVCMALSIALMIANKRDTAIWMVGMAWVLDSLFVMDGIE